LTEFGVEYLVIGGIACVLHGYVRATTDVDILIERSTENADRLLEALRGLGWGFAQEWHAEEVLARPITVIGDDPQVDIFTVAWSVTRLDYIELPLLIGGVALAANGIGARLYTAIGIAFPVACSSTSTFACDSKKGTEWAWPVGLQVGRWSSQDRFVALDVRYSIGISDAFDVSLAANRSWQFRAYVGFPIGGARGR
jgi:hypothetical protein